MGERMPFVCLLVPCRESNPTRPPRTELWTFIRLDSQRLKADVCELRDIRPLAP